MRDLLANARRLGLAALAATAVTLALAAEASGTIASRGGAHGGPRTTGAPATSGGADSTIVTQNGDPADNPPPTVVCPTCAFSITTTNLPTPVLNQVYAQTIVAAGGAAPITFTVSSGALPAGLSLAPNGALIGTPTAPGGYSFTVKAADASGAADTHTYSGIITASLAITTTSLPTPVLNQAYDQAIAVSGGGAPFSLTVSGGTLPAGLYLADGAIAGTPTAARAYSFTIKAADAKGTSATQTYSGTIAGTFAITTVSLPTPVLNRAYDQAIAVSGGGAPISLTVSGGSLPAGLYLADGAIAGTPTAAGAYSFTVKAADAKGTSATQTYSGTIARTLAITTASLPTPTLNQAYSQAIAVSGGAAPISFSVSDGTLPGGLHLADGAIAGTPTAAGPYNFTVKAADASGATATQTYSGTIAAALAIATASLPTPVLNQAYNQRLTVSDGAAPISFSVSGGALPAGMYLADGTIAGAPTAAGAYSFTIKAADAKGTSATQTYSGTIAGTFAITTVSLPTPVLNRAYDQAIAVSGGGAPTSLTVSGGSLPAGLNLAGGAIAGTPTAAGAYIFTIKAADAKGTSATQTYSGSIAEILATATPATGGPALAIATASLPTPGLNQPYDQPIAAAGGVEPISFSVSDGALPAGLSLAGNALSGTPTAAGLYSFTIKAADANGATATQTYSGTIPAALVAHSVTATVDHNSTNAPIALNISGGLVAGVTVVTPASHGVAIAHGSSITYTPTSGYAGSDSFQYTATGDAGASPPATVSIIVNSQAPVADAVSETVGYDSTNNAINLDVSGGQADRVAISTQPAHGKASASGTSISYTPTRGYSGSDSFQYTAANEAGESSPATVSITVNPQAPIARGVRETVEVNSTNNEINLAIVGGPPDSVAVAAPATQGTATASGTSIIYSPRADFEGSDSFQYIAANAGGTSNAATVSVIVRAPAVSREARSRAVSREAQGQAVSHEAQDPSVSHEARNRCAALDPDTSIAGCTELIQSGALRSTDLAITYNNRGMAYDAERQYDNAISDFSSAIGIESGVAEIYFNRGVAYDSKGLTDQAIADYGRAIVLRPDDANAYIRRGVDYRAKSRTDQAIADFTQAIRLRPGGAEAYDDRAGAYSSKGAGDEAIADLTQAIALRPRFAQAYIDRAAIYMNKGLYDQSITDSTEAIALKPNDAGGYVNRAAAYIGKGVYSQAIADATRAIALEPDDALAYNNRAVADNFSALFDQAIDDATQAIALEPDYALAYLNRAIAEDARGRRDQTIADLRAALEIDPTLQKARDGLTHLGVTP